MKFWKLNVKNNEFVWFTVNWSEETTPSGINQPGNKNTLRQTLNIFLWFSWGCRKDYPYLTYYYLSINHLFQHSHKKRKDSLETRAELAIFLLTWVPRIIRSQSTRACMKHKQKAAVNHRTVKSKRIIFVLCPEFENVWWELA